MMGGENSVGILGGGSTAATQITIFPRSKISVQDFSHMCLHVWKNMQSFRNISIQDMSRLKEFVVQSASVPQYTPYSFLRLLVGTTTIMIMMMMLA